jgi:hypothetical protein
MNTYIIGDLHIKEKEPYRQAVNLFIDWLSGITTNQDNIICTGDIVDKGWTTSEENFIVIQILLKKLKFKNFYICVGNHPWKKGKLTIKFLKNFDDIHVIDTPQIININSKKFLFLPHLVNKIDGMSMKEYYENLPPELNTGDYIIGHFHYKPFFDTDTSWIDITGMNGELILGHHHQGYLAEGKDFYIGSPLVDRYDHREKNSYILKMDSNSVKSFIPVPRFIDYQSVIYPNPLPPKLSNYVVWDVLESLDKATTIDHYEKLFQKNEETFYYREDGIHKKVELDPDGNNADYNLDIQGTSKSIRDYIQEYYRIKKVPNKIQEIVNSKLSTKILS